MALSPGLYVVAVPIGNSDDITLRALDTLRQVEVIICEERKSAYRLLKAYGINPTLYELNEHSKAMDIKQLFDELLVMQDKAIALISDAGTPAFADPGAELVQLCHDYHVAVYPVPGASSLMSALMLSGIKDSRFVYPGFLSAKKEERISRLKQLKPLLSEYDIVLLEAPYRLKAVIEDMSGVWGKKRRIRLMYKLTYPGQRVFIGSMEELLSQIDTYPKGEFVLIIERDNRFGNAI